MLKPVLSLLLLAIALSCAGCYPCHYTDHPGAKGRVVDARSHAPIPGTKIDLTGGYLETDMLLVKQAVSAPDGSFTLVPLQHWGIRLMLPFDPARWTMKAGFHAKGYKPASRTFHSTCFGPALTGLGDIPLQPVK